MGYNLSVGCHTHRVQCSSLRGQEALVIRRFGAAHPTSKGCVRDVSIDNGFAERDWAEGPDAYEDVYDELLADVSPIARWASSSDECSRG